MTRARRARSAWRAWAWATLLLSPGAPLAHPALAGEPDAPALSSDGKLEGAAAYADGAPSAPETVRDTDRTDQLEQLILEELPRIVTAAAFREQSPEEAPSAVLIITADDIRASGARTLGEALERCAGIGLIPGDHLSVRGMGQVNRIGGVGDASRILLMVDGVRVNDVFSDSFTVGPIMGVEDIARIEVIKGPGSALYGTSAFAGVVQVVTSSGSDQPGAEGILRLQGLPDGSVELRAGRIAGAWEGSLYGRAQATGLNVREPSAAVEIRGSTGHHGLLLTGSYARAIAAGYDVAPPSSGDGTTSIPAGPPLPGSTEQQVAAAVQWEHAFSPSVYTLARVSANGRTDEVPDRGVDIQEGRLTGEARLRLRLTPRLWTTAGVELRTEGVDMPSSAEGSSPSILSRRVGGAYAQVEVGPFLATTLTAGVRGERLEPADNGVESAAFQMVSPRLGLVTALPSRTVLKAFYGQAYQAPSLSMLFYDTRTESTTILANPTLAPEQLRSVEIEAGQPLPGGFYARINAFQDLVDALISPAFTDQEGVLRFENQGAARIRGLEAEVTWAPRPALQLFGNVTLLDARRQSTGEPLPLTPTLRANAGLRGSPLKGTTGWLSVSYIGAQHGVEGDPLSPDLNVDSRLRMDARFAVDLGARWQLALSVRNLFDRTGIDFAETQLFTTTGTEAWLELSFKPPHAARRRAPLSEEAL